MNCPFCDGDTTVADSRPTSENQIRRRRRCLEPGCGQTFATLETLISVSALTTEEVQRRNHDTKRAIRLSRALGRLKQGDRNFVYEVLRRLTDVDLSAEPEREAA